MTALEFFVWLVVLSFAGAVVIGIRPPDSPVEEKGKSVSVDMRQKARDRAILMTGASQEQPQRWRVLETPPKQSPFKRTILIHLKPLGGGGASATGLESRAFEVSALHTFFTEFQKLKKDHLITLRFVGISDLSRWEEEMSYLAPDTAEVRDYLSSICPF
ncbi:hypothetical protein IT398_00445 [Candidatus Nomurabacteria bacterium]|nr:hypothetical protein [Candidatus Nomurabacteria bacterium]